MANFQEISCLPPIPGKGRAGPLLAGWNQGLRDAGQAALLDCLQEERLRAFHAIQVERQIGLDATLRHGLGMEELLRLTALRPEGRAAALMAVAKLRRGLTAARMEKIIEDLLEKRPELAAEKIEKPVKEKKDRPSRRRRL